MNQELRTTKERQECGRDVREARRLLQNGLRAWTARDERDGVARVAFCRDGLDVAVVACQRQGETEFLGKREERGEKGVEGAEDFGRRLVASGMSGAVCEEVLEKRVVIAQRDLDEVLGRFGRRHKRSLVAF